MTDPTEPTPAPTPEPEPEQSTFANSLNFVTRPTWNLPNFGRTDADTVAVAFAK